jgi:hypothetical protein
MRPEERIAALTKAHSDAQMEDQFRDAALPQSHTYAASDAFHRLLRNEAAWLLSVAAAAVAETAGERSGVIGDELVALRDARRRAVGGKP